MPSGFIRVKLLQCERGNASSADQTETFDPFVGVKVKESEEVAGKRQHVRLINNSSVKFTSN